jgi:chloramphenicol 3-O-phosphotransferase
MWQRLSNPDVLIYLDINYDEARSRRPHIDGGPRRLQEQHSRLAHAREHCDYYLDTTDLTPEEVRAAVFRFLNTRRPR